MDYLKTPSESESAPAQTEQRRVSFSPKLGRYDHGQVDENAWNSRRPQNRLGSSTHSISPTLVVELYDLHPNVSHDGKELADVIWFQLGRWIKYEEVVEGVDGRFGRPRIPVLSYHSLLLLNKYMTAAVFLPDLEADTFGDVTLSITEAFAERYDMKTKGAKAFMETFCKDLKRIPGDGTDMRKCSLATVSVPSQKRSALLQAIQDSTNKVIDQQATSNAEGSLRTDQESSLRRKSAAALRTSFQGQQLTDEEISAARRRSRSVGGLPPPPVHHLRKISKRQQIARKLSAVSGRSTTKRTIDYVQEGAESCQVFTGVIPELRDVRLAMARLTTSITVPDCIDSLPIRFVFVAVGPAVSDVHYSEVGRAVATLMANPAFQEIAYTATDKAELLQGLQEFMDSSVVIPPGDIYKNDLVHVEDVRKTLRSRKVQKGALTMRKHTTESVSSQTQARKHSDALEAGEQPEDAAVEPMKEPEESFGRPWERTGRLFGGFIRDVKKRAPLYLSDFKDALDLHCISVTVFMFFVAFAPAISFGQVMNERFEGLIGISEVFIAQGVGGIIWALFSCQPLLIQAATGPFLIFETALYQFCKRKRLEFLPVRIWVGFWTFIISILIVLGEGSFLVGYVTRFTEDIFTCLIAGIFIYEAGTFIVQTFMENPLLSTAEYCFSFSPFNGSLTNSTDPSNRTLFTPSLTSAVLQDQPNTAMVSMALVLGTFVLAFILKKIRTSHFFGRTIRKALGDFGVLITIVIMVLIANFAFNETYLEFVDMPPTFGLTQPAKRGWVIYPMGVNEPLPTWIIGGAIIPAFLISILFFAETEITQLLLTSKERGLRKPMGFHWDLVLSGSLIFAVSFFGLPWMCAGAVQSLTHASALTVMKKTAPGEKPVVDYVVEQRVTTMLVAVLIGACSFLGQVLKYIPIAVLLGVFLYLGVSCLLNVQFIHRLVLLFIPRKYFPDLPYCKKVSMRRMHAYTLCQLFAFVVLWIVHAIPQSALAFPLVIALEAVARRFLLPRLFSILELEALDASDAHGEKVVEEDDDDLDVYDEVPLPM